MLKINLQSMTISICLAICWWVCSLHPFTEFLTSFTSLVNNNTIECRSGLLFSYFTRRGCHLTLGVRWTTAPGFILLDDHHQTLQLTMLSNKKSAQNKWKHLSFLNKLWCNYFPIFGKVFVQISLYYKQIEDNS